MKMAMLKALRSNTAWPAVGLAALIWLMSLAYGFQYLFVEGERLLYFRLLTVPFVGIVAGLTWYAFVRAAAEPTELSAPWWLGLAMMGVSFGLACFFYSAQLAPLPWPLLAVGLPLVAYLCHRRWGYRGANGAFLVGAALVFAYLIARIPHDASGDMLQIIGFASHDLLAGESPYQPYLTSSGKAVPFGYLPGVWLPYAAFVALGIDMRVLNLLALALIVVLFELTPKDRLKAPDILSLTFYPFILSSPVWQMILFGHLWLYWLLAAATVLLVARDRLTAAGFLFGLCLATRPTALWLAGPIAAYVWSRHGPSRTIKSAAISIAVVISVNLLFAWLYGQDFWNNSYARMVGFGQTLVHFSLAGYLQDAGLLWLSKPSQALLTLAAMGFLVVRKRITPTGFVLVVGLTYVWLVLLNSYATRYVYFTGFFLIALGLTMAWAPQTQQRS
jgi:hypothetical protein